GLARWYRPATRTGRCRPTTDIWRPANAALRPFPFRAQGARQTAHNPYVPSRAPSAGFSGKCRHFRPREQWKRLAFSGLRLEAYFHLGQSGAAFVLSPDKSPVPIESERVSRFLI